jgi:hypothetical protein
MGFWDKLAPKVVAHSALVKGVVDKMAEEKEDVIPDTSLGEKEGFYSPNTLLKEKALEDYMNRDKFSYDFNADALYQQYKDKYIQQGKMAMMDTMGQAAAMTGGYGNSYAQSVGQQAYAAQLENLNDVVPELYQMALDNYNREGDEMLNKYALYSAEEQNDYDRWWNEKQWEQKYGEEEVEEEAPTYPDWYQEGGTDSWNDAEANVTDYANLKRFLGLDETTPVGKALFDAARERTGKEDRDEAIAAAFQMMNREFNYGEVYLDPNILANVKALKTTGDIQTYVNYLESVGMINPATADYLLTTYSVTSEGGTKRSEIEEKAKTFTDNDALAAWAYSLADQGIISEDEAYSLIEENYKEE